jgi:transitional endoplasmic reticulum ATPase
LGLKKLKQIAPYFVINRGLQKKSSLSNEITLPSILLWGPPGCGKSLLASATAKDFGVKIIFIDFANLLFGCTCWTNTNNTDRVEALFSEAEKSVPSVIFLEGVDVISPLPPEWQLSAYNQLLKERDKPRS